MKLVLLLFGILFSSLIYGQEINSNSLKLKFVLRALPDNVWYFSLNDDGTYDYKHVSLFYDEEGTILESGDYHIKNNQIFLNCTDGDCELGSQNYFIEKLDETNYEAWIIKDTEKKYRLRFVEL